MIIKTIQPKKIYDEIIENGVFHTTYSTFATHDMIKTAYNYMFEKLNEKCGNGKYGQTFPIWGWSKYDDNIAPTDLSGYGEIGEEMVILTLDIDEERLLLSNYDTWHYCLNGWYLFTSEIEENTISPKEVCDKMINSWYNIFNLELENDYIGSCNYIQCVFWEILKEDIIDTSFFIGYIDEEDENDDEGEDN